MNRIILLTITAGVACTCAQSNGTMGLITSAFDNHPRLAEQQYWHRRRTPASARARSSRGGWRGFFEAAYVPPAPEPLRPPVLCAPVAAPLVISREPRRNPRHASRGSHAANGDRQLS